jgi:membrane protease YdiL (CAAX protease family)
MSTLRWRVLIELSTLLLLSTALLLRFPQRPAWINLVLALFGLGLILHNLSFTRNVVWRSFPVRCQRRDCILRSLVVTSMFTLVAMLALGTVAWWRDGCAPQLSASLLLVLPLYIGWGLLQQTLFQFFLLGRLLVLWPPPLAITVTALAFGLVHIAQPVTAGLTLVAGLVWASLYYRYRVLWPLALSHALLGAALFHWVYGRDLLVHWGVDV